MPVAGTFRNLIVNGTGIVALVTNTITVYKNGVATSLTATIAIGQQTASNTTAFFTCAANDLISIRYAAGNDYGPIAISCEFTP